MMELHYIAIGSKYRIDRYGDMHDGDVRCDGYIMRTDNPFKTTDMYDVTDM